MNAIQFEQANVLYVAEGCGDLPVCRSIDTDMKSLSLISCWEPTDEEMTYIQECIANGQKPKFYLDILSAEHPPVWVGCNLFEEGESDGNE